MHSLYFKLQLVKLCQDSVIDISGLNVLNGEIQEHWIN